MPFTPKIWSNTVTANTRTSGAQFDTQVVQLGNGDFWVAWTDGNDGGVASPGGKDIVGQRYNALGEPIGGETLLNYNTMHDQRGAVLATGPTGDQLYVLYVNNNAPADPTNNTYYLDVRKPDGTLLSSVPVAAGQNSSFDIRNADMAIVSAQTGMVVYESFNDLNQTDVYAQRFNPANGQPSGAPILISTGFGRGFDPDVANLATGTYGIVYREAKANALADTDIKGAIVTHLGAVTDFTVAGSAAVQRDPTITPLANGNFVVTWTEGAVGAGDIKGAIFNTSGVQQGAVFVVANGVDDQDASTVTATHDGGFVVAWEDYSDDLLMIQSFASNGVAVGFLTQMNSYANPQDPGKLTRLQDGRFILSYDNGDARFQILDPRTNANANPVYTNGSRQIGTPGNDSFTGDAEMVNGWDGNDTITAGQTFSGLISGDAGDDTIILNSVIGTDNADGGAGIDTLTYSVLPGITTINLHYGTAIGGFSEQSVKNFENLDVQAATKRVILIGSEGNNTVVSGSGNDDLFGLGGDDIIKGGGGDDLLDGGEGADTTYGGDGHDEHRVDNALDKVSELANHGTDTVIAAVSYQLASQSHVESLVGRADVEAIDLTGNDFDQTIIGTFGANMLSGLGGKDILHGGDGADILDGGTGDDQLMGGAGDDLLDLADGGKESAYGGEGDDGLYFGAAFTNDDHANGGPGGMDQLGLQGNYPALVFDAGDLSGLEYLVLLSGTDKRFGAPGNQSFDYRITMHDENVGPERQLVASFNSLLAGEDVTFNGAAEQNGSFMTFGGQGVDLITGGQQSDGFFFGADGRFGAGDRLDGQSGALDQFALQGDYSGGNKLALAADALSGVEMIVLLSAGDKRFGSGSADGYSYDLTLSDGNIAAGQAMYVSANTLKADGSLVETLRLDASAELDGRLVVYGGEGADVIIGGSGADELSGRGGSDTLTGGGGADRFVFAVAPGADNVDTVSDFVTGLDLLVLDNAVFGGLATGSVAPGAFQLGAAASQADDRIGYDSATGALWFDVDGAGGAAAVQFATLSTGLALSSADFLVI